MKRKTKMPPLLDFALWAVVRPASGLYDRVCEMWLEQKRSSFLPLIEHLWKGGERGSGVHPQCQWEWKLLNGGVRWKSRDVTLPTKVHLVKAMFFPVFMYGCESRAIRKTEHQRIDSFELWCWRRLLRVPWTARRSNQSILKEMNPEYSQEQDAEAEALILWPPDAKSWLIEKDPGAGKDWRQEEKGMTEDEMASPTQLSKLWKIVKGREAWCVAVCGITKSQTWLSESNNPVRTLLLPPKNR